MADSVLLVLTKIRSALIEQASMTIMRGIRSSLNHLQSKQVSEWNSTSEQQTFSENSKKDAVKCLGYRDINEIEAFYLSELRINLLLVATLAASVSYSSSLSSPGVFSSDNDGAHHAEGFPLQVTYQSLYMAFIYFFATILIASMVFVTLGSECLSHCPRSLCTHKAACRVLDNFSITWRLQWLRLLQKLYLTRTVTCYGYGFASWVLRCGVAMIGLTAGIDIFSSRTVMSSIEFYALVVTILLCSGLEFLAFLCKSVENCDHNIREPLLYCSKFDTAERQRHPDPALSDTQEYVPELLTKLFEVPADKVEDMKCKTEKGEKLLLLVAVLAASLTYQASLTPPGALWQENEAHHVVGNLVLNDNHRRRYMAFFYCNATAIVSSVAIILLLVIRKLFARGILSNTLSVCVIIDMVGLTGAFTAVTSRRASTSKYVFVLVLTVVVCTALQVLGDHSVLQRDRRGRSKYPLNFVTPDHLQGLIGVNATGNHRTRESADPAVDDEHNANSPIKRSPREATWRVACAAGHHMTGNQSLLVNSGYTPVHNGNEGVFINLANREAVPLQVQGCGSVRTESIALDDVWYIPGLDSNLVSTGQLARQGCSISLSRSGCCITRGGVLVGAASFTEEGQFKLDFLKVAASSM